MDKRDAFFYYLLVANIVLLVIVGVLVFGAVKTMYFKLLVEDYVQACDKKKCKFY